MPLPSTMARGASRQLARGGRAGADPYWPQAWIAALVFFGLVVSRFSEMLGPLSRVRPVMLATGIIGILLVVKSRPQAWRLAVGERQIRLLLSYSVWAAVTVPFALWRGMAFDSLLTLPTAILVTLSILLVAPTVQNLDRLTTGVVAIVGGYGFATLSFGRTVGEGRLTGTGALDPNDLAGLMAMILPMAVWLGMGRGWRRRTIGIAASIIMLTVIVQTASRGGLVSLAVGVLVLLLALNPSRVLFSGVALAVGFFAMWHYGPPVFRERASSLFALEEDYNATSEVGRLAIWKRGIRYTMEHPITGVGMNNYAVAEGLAHYQRGTTGSWFTAHNTYVQVFAELGLLGGMLLVIMLGRAVTQGARLYRRSRRSRPHLWRPDILASVAAFAASAFFLSHAYSYSLFGILALVTYAARVNQVFIRRTRAPMGARHTPRLPPRL